MSHIKLKWWPHASCAHFKLWVGVIRLMTRSHGIVASPIGKGLLLMGSRLRGHISWFFALQLVSNVMLGFTGSPLLVSVVCSCSMILRCAACIACVRISSCFNMWIVSSYSDIAFSKSLRSLSRLHSSFRRACSTFMYMRFHGLQQHVLDGWWVGVGMGLWAARFSLKTVVLIVWASLFKSTPLHCKSD